MIDFYFKVKAIETMAAYGILGLVVLGFIVGICVRWWNKK